MQSIKHIELLLYIYRNSGGLYSSSSSFIADANFSAKLSYAQHKTLKHRLLSNLGQEMADSLLLRSLNSKSVNLSCKHLEKVPKLIGKLTRVIHIDLKSNLLKELPNEFGYLIQLESLNLGNNLFEELPLQLKTCINVTKLHLFGNHIKSLSPLVLESLWNLRILNLNNNALLTVPPEIARLSRLEYLSISGNSLRELPLEVCALSSLVELNLADNQLTSLPLAFGCLTNLQKLYLQKNQIRELPESINGCYQLCVLDIAANDLRILPTVFSSLTLKEFYYEQNPFLENNAVQSIQEEEVLSLKELAARYILKELKNRSSVVRYGLRFYPEIREQLSQSSRCAFCQELFLNTWLECVQFVELSKVNKQMKGVVPIRALLCSYKCFNAPGHIYFGVAFP